MPPPLRRRGAFWLWLGSEAAVLADADWSFLRGHLEDDLIDFEAEVIDGLADEVAVAVADVLELFGGNSYVQGATTDVGKARRFQPGLKALAVDFFLERTQDPNPLVQNGCRDWNK
jgi:hypothetical protein